MTEEIKSYDEDLSKAIESLNAGLEKIERSNDDNKSKLLKSLEQKLANAKMLYSSFLTEWRELDKNDKEIYMTKGKEYKSKLDGIASKMKSIKNEVERKELGLKDDDKTTDEILAEAKQIHISSYESTERSKKIIEETKKVGEATLEQLDEDGKKLEDVEVTLGEIYDEVDLAKKQLKSIARKITSGKICRGLCILVLMGILAILIYIIVKPSKASGSPEGQRPVSPEPEQTLSFL